MLSDDPLAQPEAIERPDLPWPLLAGCVVVGAAACLGLVASHGIGLFYELPHYAEIARHLARGEGFVTGIATPSALAGYLEQGLVAPPWPVADRFLGPALAAAMFVRCGVEPVWAVVLVDALSAGVLLAAAVALANLLGGRRAALFAFVLAGSNPLLLCTWAQGGLADPPFAACTAALIVLVVRHADRPPSWRTSLLAGALGGAALLFRYNFVLWLPALVVLWWRVARPRGLAHVAVAVSAALVAAGVPALVFWLGPTPRASYVVGTWNLVADVVTREEPWTLFRVWHSEEAWSQGAKVLVQKALGNARDLVTSAWDLFRAPLVLPCALLGAFDRSIRRALVVMGLLLLPHVLLFVVTRSEASLGSVWQDRYLAPAFVPVFVVAATVLARLAGHRLARWVAFGVVAGTVAALPFGLLELPGMPTREQHWGRDLLEAQPAARPVMANSAFPLAYLFDRPAIYLPATPDEAVRILAAMPLQLVIVDSAYPIRPAWRRALEHDKLQGFATSSGLSEPLLVLDAQGSFGAVAFAPPDSGDAAPAPGP